MEIRRAAEQTRTFFETCSSPSSSAGVTAASAFGHVLSACARSCHKVEGFFPATWTSPGACEEETSEW